jgi:hypothetical protein
MSFSTSGTPTLASFASTRQPSANSARPRNSHKERQHAAQVVPVAPVVVDTLGGVDSDHGCD